MNPLILAALIGGATGGVSAASRGTDPWKGILTGAATGAVTSGLGSLIGPSASAGQEMALTAAEEKLKQEAIKQSINKSGQHVLSSASGGAEAYAKNQLAMQAKRDALTSAAKYGNPTNYGLGEAAKEVPFKNFKKAMDPFGMAQNEKIGRMAYATTPSAAWAGELAFNPPEKKKKKGPPLNMMYGRNPGRFGFGEWFDEDKVKEIYEDKDNPYYYPEYAEGGQVSPMVGAAGTAQAVAEYLQANGVEPTMENVQDVIEKIIAQQQQPYEPMTGLGGQLQRMTQQYARPMGEEVIEESETVQGMNQGGTPRRYYQEGGLGAMMGDMMPSGDLDMRPGGEPVGPGTGTSDDIPSMLSDGEFVMTAQAVEGAGGGDRELGSNRMMNMMRNFEQGGEPSQESQGLGSMEETTMTEMIGPQGMMMEDTMMEGVA
jgi:hypothetical protein